MRSGSGIVAVTRIAQTGSFFNTNVPLNLRQMRVSCGFMLPEGPPPACVTRSTVAYVPALLRSLVFSSIDRNTSRAIVTGWIVSGFVTNVPARNHQKAALVPCGVHCQRRR